MGAASTFIKEGIRHISAVQRMAPRGVMNDTVIHLCVCVCSVLLFTTCRHLWAVIEFVCQSELDQMFCRIDAICLILTVVLSLVVMSWSQHVCLINTRHSLADKVKVKCISSGPFPLLSLLFSVSHLPLFLQVFIFLLRPAYGLLYYSWTPYCFWLMLNACFPSHIPSALQILIYNLAGLSFRITELLVTSYKAHTHTPLRIYIFPKMCWILQSN